MKIKGKVSRISDKSLPDARISEHSPMWHEAVIDHGKGVVVVKFSASTDVAWYKMPKLTVGQEGVFEIDEDWAVTSFTP